MKVSWMVSIVGGISVFIALSVCSAKMPEQAERNKIVNLYIWDNYIGKNTVADFEKKTGIRVRIITYTDEEEMISNLMQTPEKYDLIVASTDTVVELNKMRLTKRIDITPLSGMSALSSEHLLPSEQEILHYGIPYLWGTTGIVYNKKYIKEESPTWKMLWNPAYRGKIAMLDSPPEVLAAALKMKGYSLNTIKVRELDDACKALHAQTECDPGYYDYVTTSQMMIDEQVWAAQIYNGEGMSVCAQNPDLVYAIPVEGCSLWTDYFCFSRDIQNSEAAYAFLSYMLEPEVNAAIADELRYATCNSASLPYVKEELKENPHLYLSEDMEKKCERFMYTKSTEDIMIYNQKVNRMWADIQRVAAEKKALENGI